MYEYLKYPEYEHNYQLEKLNKKYVEPLSSYINNTKYTDIITATGNFTSNSLQKFRELNLFSMSFPQEYNGKQLDSTGITRLIEICSVYPSLGINLIYNNEIASKCLLMYGSNEQRDKYLAKLSSGQIQLGFCYSEPDNGCDLANFNLISKIENKNLPTDQLSYILNGKKSWVTLISTDDEAYLKQNLALLVFSKTINSTNEIDGDDKKMLNAFIVDANQSGIKLTKKLSNNNGLNLYEIEFKDVKLKSQSLLGTLGSGFEISNKIIENSRYLIGAICISILKDFYKETIQYCINTSRFGKALSEYSLIKERLAYIETSLYTMESMTYLTAGIVDSFEQPDVGLESALTKIFCTESLKTSINDCISIMGMHGVSNSFNELKRKYLLDLNYISAMLNTNDYLRLYTSTNGMVLAGIEYGDSVRKLRNPFNYPGYFIRQIIANHRLVKASIKKTPEYLYLWEHVHPSLKEQSRLLEQSSVKFMLAVKSTMIGIGRDTIESQIHLKYLSEMSMHIYAMNSVISRASRAYSIGLPNAQHELMLAAIQSQQSSTYINNICKFIADSQSGVGIENVLVNVGEKVLKSKDHAAVHCLTRNY